MFRGWVLASLLAVTLNPGVCAGTDEGPAAAYDKFAKAFDQGDVTAMWGLLSAETQAALTTQAKKVAAFSHTKPPVDGRQLAFRDVLMAHRNLSRIAVKDESAGHATLEVTDDKGGTQVIHVVQEDGAWRLDLTHELQAAASRQ